MKKLFQLNLLLFFIIANFSACSKGKKETKITDKQREKYDEYMEYIRNLQSNIGTILEKIDIEKAKKKIQKIILCFQKEDKNIKTYFSLSKKKYQLSLDYLKKGLEYVSCRDMHEKIKIAGQIENIRHQLNDID